MEMQTFTQTFTVRQDECDLRNEMTAAAYLRRAQQLAIDHCNAVGLTDEVYARTGTAFLMAKATVQLLHPVRVGQTLTGTTIPTMPRRAACNRLTVFVDEQGREAAVCDSRWVIVDVNSRRILRQPPEEMHFPFFEPEGRQLPFELPRLALEGEGETIRAAYSLCDCNGHINNTRYADILCDALPCTALENARIAALTINYHSEVPYGQSFSLAAAEGENGYWYLCGQKEGRRCIEAGIQLSSLSGTETVRS